MKRGRRFQIQANRTQPKTLNWFQGFRNAATHKQSSIRFPKKPLHRNTHQACESLQELPVISMCAVFTGGACDRHVLSRRPAAGGPVEHIVHGNPQETFVEHLTHSSYSQLIQVWSCVVQNTSVFTWTAQSRSPNMRRKLEVESKSIQLYANHRFELI